MKIQSYPIQLFGEAKFESKAVVQIPVGSILRDAKVMPDGIFVFYEVPELPEDSKVGLQMMSQAFYTLKPNESIPENHEFVTILDTIIGTPTGQVFAVFPIYKKSTNEESELAKVISAFK